MDLKLYHSVRKADVLHTVLGVSWNRGLLNIAMVLYGASSMETFFLLQKMTKTIYLLLD